MNPLTWLSALTSEDVQRYVRIVLQWAAAALVTRGIISSNASWIEPAIGVLVGIASLAWTLYGNRLVAKLNEVAKQDEVTKVVVTDQATAASVPSPKVQSK